jgi:hypothetical protein
MSCFLPPMAMRSLALFSLVLVACSGATAGSEHTGTQAIDLACSWPSSLDPPSDGASWAVGRYLLSCQDGTATETCVSEAPDACPGPNPVVGATPTNCTDQCQDDEYAVSVSALPEAPGASAPPAAPALPASCHTQSVTPGSALYCCTCQ